MAENQSFKKQGLLLIVDSYLTQSTPAALQFLSRHIGSTEELASSLGSSLEEGLSAGQVAINQSLYGKNKPKVDLISPVQRFFKIFTEQVCQYRVAGLMLLILFQLVTSRVWHLQNLGLATATIVISLSLSLAITVALKWRQTLIQEHRVHLAEPNTVFAYRGGHKVSVQEEELTVGDLVFVDYNQTIPATGILTSRDEIELEEVEFGRGLQTKMPLEDCLESLTSKNQLQMRMDVYSGAMASPMLVRGTQNTTGRTFNMMILAVEEHDILDRQRLSKYHEKSTSAVETWISNITAITRKISSVILGVVVCFHILALIFKIKGLPMGLFAPLATTILESLHPIMALTLLTDPLLLRSLLTASYLQVAGMLGTRQNVDRFLAVEQLFLNEESICKYDSLVPRKVVLIDLPKPVDIRLLPALKPQKAYSLIYEILAGVGLQSGLPQPKTFKLHKNTIIHIISLQERVFSSLYAASPQQPPSGPSLQEGDSMSEIARTQGHLMRECNSNRITPESEVEEVSRISHSIQLGDEWEKTASIGRQKMDTMKEQGRPEHWVKLDEYLSKHCHFSTQNILEGIHKLAKHFSRTYFFQVFSIERLSQIRHIWSQGRFYPATVERQEQLLLGIKRIEKDGLCPYLMGFDDGAFSKKFMTYLLGVVGVEVTREQQVIRKLHQLQDIGVHTLFTLQEHEEEKFTSKHIQLIQQQFLSRQWALPEHQFKSIKTVQDQGGRLVCTECLTSACKCRIRKNQLSNPQGFLQAVTDLRCVWGVTQPDLKYLEQSFEQLGMTTLRLIDHHEDIPRKLDQIIAGNELFNGLQENMALWFGWICTISLCYFPFNYLTFDNILTCPQLYFSLLYFQALLVPHHIFGSATLFPISSLTRSKRKRQMLGISLKAEITVFILMLTAGSFTCISNPQWFGGALPRDGLPGLSCQQVPSFYHNPSIAKALCEDVDSSIVLFSKPGTFILLFNLLAFTLNSALAVNRPLSKGNLLYHVAIVALLVGLVYLVPQFLQTVQQGLSLRELGVCLGCAAGAVVLSKLARAGLEMTESGRIFHFEVRMGDSGNDYAELLKEHKDGRTMQFQLNKKQCSLG